jgi:hypothetical protein
MVDKLASFWVSSWDKIGENEVGDMKPILCKCQFIKHWNLKYNTMGLKSSTCASSTATTIRILRFPQYWQNTALNLSYKVKHLTLTGEMLEIFNNRRMKNNVCQKITSLNTWWLFSTLNCNLQSAAFQPKIRNSYTNSFNRVSENTTQCSVPNVKIE